MTHPFTTTVTLDDDKEVEVVVTYDFHKGFAGDWTDPPEPDMVEIISTTPDVPFAVYDDLVAEAFEDYEAYQADAAEYRAEARREGW